MKRNLMSLAMLGFMCGSALAGTVDDLLAGLAAQGFTVTEVKRTILGNYKIEAKGSGGVEREVVYNPYLDKVLRDKTDSEDRHSGRSGSSSRSASSGSDDSDDDGNDDGADHDSNDDHGGDSGHDSGSDHDSGGDDHGGGDD
ncbi:PepSY domain-containing protein [Rhizobium sp. NRK18]|uniref:PepSY domain-containing protein n=1 Tax=Rhizobium sp. NRK18 TaxID=2964667 RepID=UPI0021C48DEE|nr:PepSY domain-containing protein [Rhizobium sp. NRK18]MCQ2002854.1 PepSY domain-containing protein [Rhizobium sp. NRK18]